MSNPLISVVIPLYNKEKNIAATLKSVLSQEGCAYEVVVVDDGSTDNSVGVVEAFADERIHLYKQANGGPSKARNTGMRKATGDWIVFLDADDELLPGAMEIFAKLIAAHPNIDLFDCGNVDLRNGVSTSGYHPIEGYVSNPMRECFYARISPGNARTALRREYALRFRYDERIRRFEDAEWLGRLLPNARVYSTTAQTLLFNRDAAEASHPRKNVEEDYFAYLDFRNGGFWQRMCAYRCFLEERELYPEYGRKHYKRMYHRYDLLILFKVLNWWNRHFWK